jgi:hypothetical protein
MSAVVLSCLSAAGLRTLASTDHHEALRREWADAYRNEEVYADGMLRVCYMLAGAEGRGNIDPYTEGWSRS